MTVKVKKILACVLAFVILISAVPAVYAAGDDAGMSIFFDNNAPQAGDTITITLNVNRIFSDAAILETYLDFGEDVTYVKTEFLNVELNSRMIDSSRLHIYGWGDEDEEIAQKVKSIPTGAFARITFKISEYAAGKTLNFRLRGEFDDIDWDTLNDWDDNYSVEVTGSPVEKPTATGYTVSMGADQQVAAGQQVRIPVTVASGEKGITGFNAYDMTFTYDPAALTLNTKTGDAANLTVEDNNGTVRVRRYGATQALGEALALEFTANKATSSTVTLTAAKFDLDANSINFDAPDANISDADTVVNANNFTVTLPDEFTSDAETRLVPGGGSFTFKPVDSHYTYTFTVKMGDTAKEGLTFGADDTYTIENISGNVVVTCTNKAPKQYDVEYVFGDKDPLLEKDVTKGAAKATYLQDYSVIVTPRAGLSYWIHYEIRYPNGTRSDQVSLTPVANADGTITYTIPGSKIDGTVCFIISTRTNDEYPGYAVLVTGNGAEDQAPGNGTSVPRDMPYYLRLNERENCTYTVTAYYQPLGSITAVNMPTTVRSLGNGKYVVDPIPDTKLSQYAYSWRLVVNVEKVSHSAEEVTVSKYLELNDKTMMLVTVKGTPEGGKAFTYDGNTMYKVNAYGADQYAWLVIVGKGQTLTQEEAAAKVAISAADNVVTITPSFDVNRTGKVDVNDAQLVYDMYNGTYSDFTKVSVEKFLRADVNATKVVDHTDAVAIVNQFN